MKPWVVVLAIVAAIGVSAETPSKQPWMGMSVRPHRDPAGQRFLHVERTVPGGPADRAGIRPGDIINKVNGNPLQYVDDLDFLFFIGERKPGERVTFHVVRQGSGKPIVVTVGVMPESARPRWELALQNARRARLQARRGQ